MTTSASRIGLVVDSNSQLPAELADRYDISVVPIVVEIDGQTFHENVDLDADAFYEHFAGGVVPNVVTSQPSPGTFVEAYNAKIAAGCDEIVSIHVGSDFSGTVNSARLAAGEVAVPVHVVDTGTASFGVSCCVWEAAEALRAGASAEQAATKAANVAERVHSTFIIQAADFARQGGRFEGRLPDSDDEVPVMVTGPGGHFEVIGSSVSSEELCDIMATAMHCDGQPIRVAIGVADRVAEPFWQGLEDRLLGRSDVAELVRYRVGPSVGAHTGPGTAGGFWYPT